MHIIPDLGPSLALTLPFFVAFFGLWFILWKPLMQFLDERDNATVGARKEAEAFAEKADSRATQLEARLAAAHSELVDLHAAARSRAQAKENEILSAARAEAEKKISDAQERIGSEKAAAKAELEVSARALSNDIVDNLLA
ncbi:MAG: ATP synthase F0 subunit B [Myxococcota bacterium]